MVSVGLRLTDQVFPGPEEPIAKLPKANENPVMILDGIDKEDGKARVKRIVLSRSANVELLHAESPSRIWVRLTNHITDNTLTFREPFELKQKKGELSVGDYAIAPTDERVYRRCRIMQIHGAKQLVKIFFIDDATTAWVKKECLGELEEHYMFFPWQAIQLSMFGVYPAVDDSVSNEQMWSTETCYQLQKILEDFPILRVEVALSTVVFNDYAKPIPVNFFGIEADVEEREQSYRAKSIAQILEKIVPSKIVFMNLHDAAFHEIFEVAEQEEIPAEALEIHREFQDLKEWKTKNDADEHKYQEEKSKLFSKDSMTPEMEHSDWDPRQNSIEMLSIKQLAEKFQFHDKNGEPRIMLAVEGKCTKSPFEWYARPIVKTGKNSRDENVPWTDREELKEVDEVDWMLYGNDQLLSVAEQLDTYYSNPKNRKPLKGDEIEAMRKEGREVFAVCAVNEEKAMYTGEWQRVLIVNCDTFAEVRFLDSGGRDMVLTSSLYRIHKQHCRFPPMCLRFSMHGVATKLNQIRADKKWNSQETSRFKMCLREHVPIFINIRDIAPLTPISPKDPRPYMSAHVLMARNVHYLDESRSLIDRFVGTDDGCAIVSSTDPVCWPLEHLLEQSYI